MLQVPILGPSSKVLGVRVPVPGSCVPGSETPRVPGLRVLVLRIPGSRVSGSWASESQGPKSWDSGPILDYVFIGLLFMRGLQGLAKHHKNVLLSDRHGHPVFSSTMSRLRFQFLLTHLTFDNLPTREERWKHDRFGALRETFEECNKNFGKVLIPEDFLSRDEILYPMRSQISFK